MDVRQTTDTLDLAMPFGSYGYRRITAPLRERVSAGTRTGSSRVPSLRTAINVAIGVGRIVALADVFPRHRRRLRDSG